jgi:amidase
MTNEDLCYLSATNALALFKKRRLSPVDLISALIARIERFQPKINCFTDTYFDEAMEKAKAAQEKFTKRGAKRGALEGLPLAVKDAQRVKGKRTTYGSLIFMENIDSHSDPMIERLENAGGIIFGRTTTPEFCLSGICRSRAWGNTLNPWNTNHGPGGSSGGSGAALAAGLTTLATGTDISGSIRIPSSACGTVGFKPPHGRNPDGPPSNFDRFNHCGPMTRSIADAALMQSVTAGPHPLDHDSLRQTVRLPAKPAAIKGLKVAYSIDYGYVPVNPDVRRNTLAAVDVFKSLGARVTEVELGWTSDVDTDAMHWYNAMHFGRQTVWWRKTHSHLMTDYALNFAEAAETNTTMDDVHKPWERAQKMYETLGPILDKYDVFICPTNNLPAVPAEHDPWNTDFTVNGIKADPEFGWVMTHPFNMLHNLPVLAVPSGFSLSGIPTGIQIVARSWDDARVFRAGLAYEKAAGGWFTSKAKRPAI